MAQNSNLDISNKDLNSSIMTGYAISKRLQNELKDLIQSGDKTISVSLEDDSIFKWIAVIEGPPNTVYSGQKYRLSLKFPRLYPEKPPFVRFLTKCFHPNIDIEGGNICLDILSYNWLNVFTAHIVLRAIQSFLGEPNADSPYNESAALLWEAPLLYKVVLTAFYEQHKDPDLKVSADI